MFILKNITIENFINIESLSLEFNSKQISAITGKNGAGKSSLLSAIAFCLTGYRRGEKAQDYVKKGAEFATIHLEALFKGFPITYDVTIGAQGGQTSRKQIEYKGMVYINSDYNQFIKENNLDDLESLMFMLKNTSDFINEKPSARAESLKKIFNYDLKSKTEPYKTILEEKKTTLIESNATLNALRSRTFELQKLMREVLPSSLNSWKERIEEIDKSLNELSNLDVNKLYTIERRLTSISSEIRTLNSRISSDTLEKDSIQSKIESLEELLENVSLDDLNARKKESEEELNKEREAWKTLKELIDTLTSELNIHRYKEKELNEQISISKNGVCHACGQPIEESHLKKLESLKEIEENFINEISSKILSYNFDVNNTASKKLEKKVKEIEEEIHNYNINSLNLESYKKRLSSIEVSLIDKRDMLCKLNTEELSLLEEKVKLEEIKPLVEKRDELLEEKESLNYKIVEARDNTVKNAERRKINETLKRDREERDSKVDELSKKVNDTSLEINDIKGAIDLIEKEFSNYLIVNACNKLSEYINSIIQNVFPTMRVTLSQSKSGVNFYYTLESSDSSWMPVSMASGAESQILSLAYKIALAKFYNLTCLCLDEIDANCSEENSVIVYKFISSITDFPQIFFISQRKEAIEVVKNSDREDITIYLVDNGVYSIVN